MKKKSVWKILALSCALVLVASSVAMYSLEKEERGISEGEGRGVISLMPPPFIGVAGANEVKGGAAFPENEAGISAYLRPVATIEIKDVKPVFASIDEERDDFIIGTVAVTSMTEDEYPYVYVASDGWIVSYYPRDTRAESCITPFGYEYTTTNLNESIKKVCDQITAPFDPSDMGYYHFKYPNATGIVMAMEKALHSSTDKFYVTIPDSFTVYNVSWAYSGSGNAKLDGRAFVSGATGPHKKFGYFSEAEFEKAVEHEIEVLGGTAPTWIGLVIIYRE